MPAVSSILAGASIAGGLGSAYISSRGASKAASSQEAAAMNALNLQNQMWNQASADVAPWVQQGQWGVNQYQNALVNPEAFKASPSYDWRLQQGQQAVERSAAAKGRLGSGATLKSLTQYGQDMASQEYQNYLNNLNTLSQQGIQATGARNALGQGYAGMGANTYNQLGSAQAGNAMAQGSIWGNALQRYAPNIAGAGLTAYNWAMPEINRYQYNAMYGPGGSNPYYGW